MCGMEWLNQCWSCFKKPYVVILIQIIFETWIISMQLYASHQTLINSMVLIDEIFGGISALYLVLSIGSLFVFSCEMFYKNYRMIGGIQAVIMITNGVIFIISVVRAENSPDCSKVEELRVGLECQPFEIRLFVGCLAIVDGILYLLRRPILFRRFVLQNEGMRSRLSLTGIFGDSHKIRREMEGKYFNSDGCMIQSTEFDARNAEIIGPGPGTGHAGTGEYRHSNISNSIQQQWSDYIMKVDVPVSTEFQTVAEPKPNQCDIFNSIDSNRVNVVREFNGDERNINVEESETRSCVGMADIVNITSPQKTNPFYYNNNNLNLEYFLPNVQQNQNPSTSKSSTNKEALHNSDSRYSRKTAEFQIPNAFA